MRLTVVCLGLVLKAFVVAPPSSCAAELPKPPLNARGFEEILEDLDSPLTNTPEHVQASEKLRECGASALPFLMEAVRRSRSIEKTNRMASMDLKMQLYAAFEALGPQAKPLLGELSDDFRAGRSLDVVSYAIAEIGGIDAGEVLIQGLTNASPLIRASAAGAMEAFKSGLEEANAAIPSLLLALDDSSPVLRSLAANTLGILSIIPEVVVPALLRVAQTDTDAVVRATAVRSIGRFGSLATVAVEPVGQIKRMIRRDMLGKWQHKHWRRCR